MNNISIDLLTSLSVITDNDKSELYHIYTNAIETLDLTVSDYLTIRDLLYLSGYNTIIVHLLLICMFICINEGSACLKLNQESLNKKLTYFTGKQSIKYARDIISNIKKYPELIYIKESHPKLFIDPSEEFKPLIYVKYENDAYLYFQKYYIYEKKLKQDMYKLLTINNEAVNIDNLISIFNEVLVTKPVIFNNSPILLNNEQKLGLLLPLIKNFVIISGGPGTGKTSLVLTLLRILIRIGIPIQKIKLSAPTGRAAQKITDALYKGIESIKNSDEIDNDLKLIKGTTLHRLLKYSPANNDFFHNSNNYIQADVIIMDEVSMVDIIMLSKFFEAVNENTRIIFLGDKNQLPSIDAGSILADMIPDNNADVYSNEIALIVKKIFPDIPLRINKDNKNILTDRVVILKKSYRYEKEIHDITEGINDNKVDLIKKIPKLTIQEGYPDKGIWLIEPSNTEKEYQKELYTLLDLWASHNFIKNEYDNTTYKDLILSASIYDFENNNDENFIKLIKNIFSYLDRTKILSPITSGPSGIKSINNYLLERLGKIFDPSCRNNLFSGTPIIITKNDYSKELFNGEIGVILKGENRCYYGIFNRYEGIISYPIEILPSFDIAYAITVHKSQGSEYDEILFILPENITERLLTREILYTGLTRTKNCAMIYGNSKTVEKTINSRVERESTIKFFD